MEQKDNNQNAQEFLYTIHVLTWDGQSFYVTDNKTGKRCYEHWLDDALSKEEQEKLPPDDADAWAKYAFALRKNDNILAKMELVLEMPNEKHLTEYVDGYYIDLKDTRYMIIYPIGKITLQPLYTMKGQKRQKEEDHERYLKWREECERETDYFMKHAAGCLGGGDGG
jgi:hypothetical protein